MVLRQFKVKRKTLHVGFKKFVKDQIITEEDVGSVKMLLTYDHIEEINIQKTIEPKEATVEEVPEEKVPEVEEPSEAAEEGAPEEDDGEPEVAWTHSKVKALNKSEQIDFLKELGVDEKDIPDREYQRIKKILELKNK